MLKKHILVTLIFFMLLALQTLFAQAYQKDSLQIKVYTEIRYIESKPYEITLKKVFCNYCSKRQLELLGEDAIRRTEIEKYDPKNKLANGKKKIAVYIRIAKTDFASIREYD